MPGLLMWISLPCFPPFSHEIFTKKFLEQFIKIISIPNAVGKVLFLLITIQNLIIIFQANR